MQLHENLTFSEICAPSLSQTLNLIEFAEILRKFDKKFFQLRLDSLKIWAYNGIVGE